MDPTGWQPRWFVLENGILSYYRSQDDVNNGCKGSVKMSVCDVTGGFTKLQSYQLYKCPKVIRLEVHLLISLLSSETVSQFFTAVHATDPSRLDLIIPGEAHFYVRAASPQERQQWLVALGSCKACLTNGRPAQPAG